MGCSIMDEGPDAAGTEGTPGTVFVTFTLATEEGTETRATWLPGQDYDEPGEGWENTIDDIRILVYNAGDNRYAGSVESIFRLRDNTYSGVLTAAAGTEWNTDTQYKVMAFANCNTQDTDLSTLANTTYTTDYATHGNHGTAYMPMWGVLTTTFTLTPGENQDLNNIDLLRAMAKVEVKLSGENVTDYEITGVTISRSNTQGYCLPKDYDKVITTGELDREEGTGIITFNPYTGSPVTEDIAFTEENGTYILYLPEYDNPSTGTSPSQISVTVKGANETEETYTLEFKEYSEGIATGEAFNIVRNHIYRYNITGIEDGKLTVEYRVMPWEVVSSGIEFTDNVTCTLLPNGGNANSGTDGDAEAVYCILYKPRYKGSSRTELETNTAGARYEFTLNAPKGTVWKAHLSNTTDFYFSDGEANGKKCVSTGITREAPYYIQINVRNEWTKNATFDQLSTWGQQVENEHRVVETYFYITVSVDGEHEEELKINPFQAVDNDNTYYKNGHRFAGTDTRIWIRQVPVQKGWSYDELAKDINPTDNDFQWWRVNPYWK